MSLVDESRSAWATTTWMNSSMPTVFQGPLIGSAGSRHRKTFCVSVLDVGTSS